MLRQFEIMHLNGEKVGEASKALTQQLAAMQSQQEDTSCGYAEEGQDEGDLELPAAGDQRSSDGPIEV